MSLENAKKFVSELQTNEELRAKKEGIEAPEELVKMAAEAGYDVTLDELIEAEKEFRQGQVQKTDEMLSLDDLKNVAGGRDKRHYIDHLDTAPDGHEIGCFVAYHGEDWCRENDIWCSFDFYHKGSDRLKVVCVDNEGSYIGTPRI